ncbi:uncharacterized protein KIAA1958 homolog [Lytechinus pictus]|uniref:uncharacterized protein KIAA1958 homolog n=1 Tax=Lytechinus pictus TaxID=7653 RepID=UPI0030BA1E62
MRPGTRKMAASMERADPQFQLLSEQEIEELINGRTSESTKRTIKFGVVRLKNFADYTNTNLDEISVECLDGFLSRFYPSIRKGDGSQFSKRSIQAIRYAVQRHFLEEREFDICDNAKFPRSNKVFKAVLVKLKKEGKSNVKHKPIISATDMERIQTSDQLDCSTLGLQNKVFIDLMTYFCNRGRENLRSMKPSDFTVEFDENVRRFVSKRDDLTKNNREDVEEGSNSGVMYEIPESESCPVRSFVLYISKLDSRCPFLWQRPKEKAPEKEGPWYSNSAVGVNILSNKMKEISRKAHCSKLYANHCIRATCITSLDTAGFQSRDIMSVSGHRSESSLKHYSRKSESRKCEMSKQLSENLYHRDNASHASSSTSKPSQSDPKCARSGPQ